jgi:hypothetical protein
VTLGPIQVALQVADALEACGLLYLVGGSVASSIGGEPRTTLDVDMVVAMAATDVDRFLAALGSEFYADDAAIRRAIRQHSSVNLIHRPSAIKVDLFIAGGSPLTSLLKDADGLDRVRLGDLDPRRLRNPQARDMIAFAEALFEETDGIVPVGPAHFAALWSEATRLLGHPHRSNEQTRGLQGRSGDG